MFIFYFIILIWFTLTIPNVDPFKPVLVSYYYVLALFSTVSAFWPSVTTT